MLAEELFSRCLLGQDAGVRGASVLHALGPHAGTTDDGGTWPFHQGRRRNRCRHQGRCAGSGNRPGACDAVERFQAMIRGKAAAGLDARSSRPGSARSHRPSAASLGVSGPSGPPSLNPGPTDGSGGRSPGPSRSNARCVVVPGSTRSTHGCPAPHERAAAAKVRRSCGHAARAPRLTFAQARVLPRALPTHDGDDPATGRSRPCRSEASRGRGTGSAGGTRRRPPRRQITDLFSKWA